MLGDLEPVFTREPGSTWIGQMVRKGIAENINPVSEALLFTADHAAHLETVIRPGLEDGKIMISDRFSDSRYAYQSVTLKDIIPEPLKWLRAIHDGWTVIPDRTFLLVLPVEDAIERLAVDRKHREHFECRDTLDEVRRNYLALAEEDPSRFILVDALMDRVGIAEFVAEEIRKRVGQDNKKSR